MKSEARAEVVLSWVGDELVELHAGGHLAACLATLWHDPKNSRAASMCAVALHIYAAIATRVTLVADNSVGCNLQRSLGLDERIGPLESGKVVDSERSERELAGLVEGVTSSLDQPQLDRRAQLWRDRSSRGAGLRLPCGGCHVRRRCLLPAMGARPGLQRSCRAGLQPCGVGSWPAAAAA